MEYRRLGATGLEVSSLCFGTSRFAREVDGTVQTDRETAHDLLDACREHGVNFLDTADVYGGGESERWIGEWLADVDREEVVVASKVGVATGDGPNDGGAARKRVRAQVEATLDRLGTDYVDVYYVHVWDGETPVRETLRTLSRLVDEGRVHHLGLSNLAAWQLVRAEWTADVEGLARIDVVEPRYNAAYREAPAPLLSACADLDVAVCPYAGLEEGFLTGKYERDEPVPEGSRGDAYEWDDRFEERQWRVLDAVRRVADETDATPAQVALRWLIDREEFTCVPIVAARSVEQLAENVGAVDVSLSGDQRERIAAAYG